MPSAIERVVERRLSHRTHGYDLKHDLRHEDGVLYKVACALIAKDHPVVFEYTAKPDDSRWIDDLLGQRRSRVDALIEAAAFIIAEIERIEATQILRPSPPAVTPEMLERA